MESHFKNSAEQINKSMSFIQMHLQGTINTKQCTLEARDGLLSWILTSPNPSPALTLIARGWIAFDDVEPYIDFNYVAPVINNVVLVQAKLIGGAFGGAGETRRWGFDGVSKACCWGSGGSPVEGASYGASVLIKWCRSSSSSGFRRCRPSSSGIPYGERVCV